MTPKRLVWMAYFAVLATFLQNSGSAQSASGAVSGRAIDSAGAILQGARVELQPRVTPVVTGAQGEFTIPALAPGPYTLTISYVGFSTFSSNLTVTAGQVTHVEATLTVASKNEQVTVYAEREHGEAEAINRERTSDNILQVLPVEVITSLPNTNIADALGRMPASPWSATRVKENMSRFAALNPASAM